MDSSIVQSGVTPPSSNGDEPQLYWSKRGHVACAMHAPHPDSGRWHAEKWSCIPDDANGRHGLFYQCPRCAPDGRVHRHSRFPV
jgi:hypothetical protein